MIFININALVTILYFYDHDTVTRKWGPRFQVTHIWISFCLCGLFLAHFHISHSWLLGQSLVLIVWWNCGLTNQWPSKLWPFFLSQLYINYSFPFNDMNKVLGLSLWVFYFKLWLILHMYDFSFKYVLIIVNNTCHLLSS